MNSKHQAMCQGWRGVCAQIAEVAKRESKDFRLFQSELYHSFSLFASMIKDKLMFEIVSKL